MAWPVRFVPDIRLSIGLYPDSFFVFLHPDNDNRIPLHLSSGHLSPHEATLVPLGVGEHSVGRRREENRDTSSGFSLDKAVHK
jgi:hypothetical protein